MITMAAVRLLLHKYVAALPSTLESNTLYFVKRGAGFDLWMTNANGLKVAYQLNKVAGGSNQQVQYNSNGDLAGATNVIISEDHLFLKDTTGATLADHLGLFADKSTGFMDLYCSDSLMGKHKLQRFFGDNNVSAVFFQGSGTSLTTAIGGSLSTVGTGSTRALSASRYGQIRKAGLGTGTLLADVAGWYSPRQIGWRGNAANTGGFYFNVGFGVTDGTFSANARTFAGLTTSVSAPAYANPFSIANAMGMGQDPSTPNPNNLYLFITGTSTTVQASLTPFLVSTANDFIILEIFVPSFSNMIYMTATSLISGTQATATFDASIIPTNQFPANNVFFSPRVWRTNGGALSTAGSIDMSHYYMELLT